MRPGAAPAALAVAVALAGCPLPQPLPDYPAGTTVTPPRILVDDIVVNGAVADAQPVILVPANCPIEPVYELAAHVTDTTNRAFDARWFVNYDEAWNYGTVETATVLPDPDPLVLTRTVPPERPFEYRAYYHLPPVGTPRPAGDPPYDDAGLVRVVELVVSNGFAEETVAPRNRAPRPTFETQVYRWVFVTVDEPAGCADTPGAPGCCPAPPP